MTEAQIVRKTPFWVVCISEKKRTGDAQTSRAAAASLETTNDDQWRTVQSDTVNAARKNPLALEARNHGISPA